MKTVEGYWDSMQKTVTFSFLCLLSSVLAESTGLHIQSNYVLCRLSAWRRIYPNVCAPRTEHITEKTLLTKLNYVKT